MKLRILSLCILVCTTLATVPVAHAQFTTVVNVPPDAAPSSIGSDTQLNFDAGGDDLPAGFQAGLPGDANNVEVNINGGTVGDMFHAGPTDASGGDVTVNISGGTLATVTSYLGAEVNVSGGQLGYVTAFGGDINSTADSTAVFQGFGVSNHGVATFDGGTVTGIPGFEGGFVSTTSASGSPRLIVNGGELMGINANVTDGSSTATLELNDGRVVGDVNGEFASGVDVFMTGGEITGDLRFDQAILTTARITGGSLQSLVTGSSSDGNSFYWPQIEILGGSIGSVDMTLGRAFVTYYGTQFSVDGADVTSILTPGVPVDVGQIDMLSGVLADGTSFSYDFPANSGLTTLVLVPGCDFDASLTCDIADLNALLLEGPVAPGVPVNVGVNDVYDLNGDNLIDNTDVDIWLADAASANGFASPYKRGDANLDGFVDGLDFIEWNANKFTSSLLWDDGDFNGDGFVDGLDFIEWNANKFTSSDGVTAVPEPSAALYLGFVFALLAALRRY